MYSAPAVTPAQVAAPQKNAVLYSLAGISCLVVSLFLIAATIVVALIPVYMSNRSTAVDQTSLFSKPIVASVPLTASTSRRRRQNDDGLDNYVGYDAGPTAKASVAAALKSKVDSKLVQDVVIDNMILNIDTDTTKKRWALTKRASRAKRFLVSIRLKFTALLTQRQVDAAGPKLNESIKQGFQSLSNLTKIDFNVNGVVTVLNIFITLKAPTSISAIVSGTSSVTVVTTPTTARSTVTSASNTTTVISSATAAATTAATTAVTTAATTVATTLLLSSTTTAAPSTTAAMTG